MGLDRRRPWGRLLGLGLVVLSVLLYLSLLIVPWLPLSTEGKVALAAALVVVGEASFWIGGLLIGREVVRKYRAYLDPRRWFRQGKDGQER